MLTPAAAAIAPADTLLRDLLAVSLTGIIFYTPLYDPAGSGDIVDFTFEYLNPAAQRMMAMPEVPTVTHNQQWPHSRAHGTFQFHVEAFVSGEPRHYDINYQADGYDNYYRLAARRSGAGLLVSFTDTADQPRTPVEAALRASQAAEQAARAEAEQQRQRFYDLLMQLPAQVAVHEGPDQVFTLVNPGYQRLAPGRELVGLPIREAWPELVSQGILDMLDHVYQSGEPFRGRELPFRVDVARTGQLELVYFNAFFLPLRDAQGQLHGVLNFSYDVTEQVQAREQLQQLNQQLELRVQERTRQLSEQQALLRQILSRVPAYIATLSGPEHRYTFFNDAYKALSGGRITLGARAIDVFPEIVPQGFLALLDQVYASGVAVSGTDTPAQLVNPATGQLEPLYADFFYQPLFDEHQQVWGILAYVQDVSEKVEARQQVQALNEQLTAINEELNESNRQLTRTNVDLDNFIYTASHDLKAPITNIEGLLLALEQELPAAAQVGDVPEMLHRMQGAIERFKRTIAHLTDISRLQKEHGQPSAPVPLAALIEEVCLDLTPLLAETQARLNVDVAACPAVTFAEKNLRSIVYNLLSNALKYRYPDRAPEVHIRCRAEAGYQVLEVQDNGLGLDLSQGQERLFQMFQRLHTHVEGTGIGLYMVKKIVENAGGRIEVESQLGQGSTFRVYFLR
ncbi:PAS domain-containing sensor histidine kinase [Hymenobacter weizhouensis]|uniref:PAS domain-containing sensor histidine kinase n=1 Tax=Hymenobacter sp. YIM 151500-1 TaxID=2987689 RepID=UPI00222739D9|nr:PAS domain-containing sensor histidine kinase [Hymenobacter sp. YIM 151500-1]UYZ64744.1 PAS domain-containing sensor histidine kinase [Hymenobacter sp. YIM 151500-1]